MDEPLADPAAIALYFVSQTAAKHVKVAMSGEDRRAMRIRIPIHPAFLEADDEVLLPDYLAADRKSVV